MLAFILLFALGPRCPVADMLSPGFLQHLLNGGSFEFWIMLVMHIWMCIFLKCVESRALLSVEWNKLPLLWVWRRQEYFSNDLEIDRSATNIFRKRKHPCVPTSEQSNALTTQELLRDASYQVPGAPQQTCSSHKHYIWKCWFLKAIVNAMDLSRKKGSAKVTCDSLHPAQPAHYIHAGGVCLHQQFFFPSAQILIENIISNIMHVGNSSDVMFC